MTDRQPQMRPSRDPRVIRMEELDKAQQEAAQRERDAAFEADAPAKSAQARNEAMMRYNAAKEASRKAREAHAQAVREVQKMHRE